VAPQLRRRAAAARRLPGGDPWAAAAGCGRESPSLTGRKLAAWSAAISHVGGEGVTPIVPVQVLRALRRGGGPGVFDG
jgi:hypothetical protein